MSRFDTFARLGSALMRRRPTDPMEDLDEIQTKSRDELAAHSSEIPLDPDHFMIPGDDGQPYLYVETKPANEEGGLGIIHKGYMPKYNRLVAIKILKPQRNELTKQMEIELPEHVEKITTEFVAGMIAAEACPGLVVQFFEHVDRFVDALNRRHLIIMDWVEVGDTKNQKLDVLLKKQDLNPTQALYLLSQMALFISQYAKAGWLHLDFKPENCFVSADWLLKVFDFNVSEPLKTMPNAAEPTVELPWALVGSLAFISPERLKVAINGQVDQDNTMTTVTVKSEIFTLGVIAYELITGRHYRTGSVSKVIMDISNEDGLATNWDEHLMYIKSALTHTTGVQPTTEQVEQVAQALDKALQPNPQDRYDNAADFIFDLSSILNIDLAQLDQDLLHAKIPKQHIQPKQPAQATAALF